MIIVNLFGAPLSGKNEAAAFVYKRLIEDGISPILALSYGKEEEMCDVYAKEVAISYYALSDEYKVMITDFPLFLTSFYGKDSVKQKEVVKEDFLIFNNLNYLICRTGETDKLKMEEDDLEGDAIQDFLDREGIVYTHGVAATSFFEHIVNEVELALRGS